MNHEVLATTPEQLYAEHKMLAGYVERSTTDLQKSEEFYADEERLLHYPNPIPGTLRRLRYIDKNRQEHQRSLRKAQAAYKENLEEANEFYDPSNQEAFWDEAVAMDKAWQTDQYIERLRSVPKIGQIILDAFGDTKERAIHIAKEDLMAATLILPNKKHPNRPRVASIFMVKKDDGTTEINLSSPPFGFVSFDSDGVSKNILTNQKLKPRKVRKVQRILSKMRPPAYYYINN